MLIWALMEGSVPHAAPGGRHLIKPAAVKWVLSPCLLMIGAPAYCRPTNSPAKPSCVAAIAARHAEFLSSCWGAYVAYVRSRKHVVVRATPLLTAFALTVLSPAVHSRALGAGTPPPTRVKGAATGFIETPSSPKCTASLLDTPRSITVMPSVVLEQQNSFSLQEALTSYVPGITFQAGEGGAGYGDSLVNRGFNATS